MSHKATNWAWGQRGLTPAQKLVLMCLADCHNPSHGCFPTQAFIAGDCEISRASVNVHLAALETMGLIRRKQVINEKTQQQRPTRYFLAFEPGFCASNTGDDSAGSGADAAGDKVGVRVQNSDTEPCPDLPQSRVQILDTNPVKDNNRKTRGRKTRPSERSESAPMPVWAGDPEIRDALVRDRRYGERFAVSNLDTATQLADGSIRAWGVVAFERLSACEVLKERRIRVVRGLASARERSPP